MIPQINWKDLPEYGRSTCAGFYGGWYFAADTFNTTSMKVEPLTIEAFAALKVVIGMLFMKNRGEKKAYIWAYDSKKGLQTKKCFMITKAEFNAMRSV
jgi:hypothetical protein